MLAGSSFSSTSADMATLFLILQIFMISTSKQIKNGPGHQAKCIVVLGLVLKHDRHDKTKCKMPTALSKKDAAEVLFRKFFKLFKKTYFIKHLRPSTYEELIIENDIKKTST